jgi:hypothetical protein
LISHPRPPEVPPEESAGVVDPTHVLLSGIRRIESRVPWTWIALGLLVALWLPAALRLRAEDLGPEKAGAALAGTFAFFLLARHVVGPAGALLSGALLCATAPWNAAARASLPLMLAQVAAFLGVWWVLRLQGRHREVGVAAATAVRMGIVGVLLGAALRLAPATLATFVAVLVVWISVTLRRSSGEATTFPITHRRRMVGISIAGAAVLVFGCAFAMWAVERFGAGTPWPPLLAVGAFPPPDTGLWLEMVRRLVSPGPATDVVVVAALALIAVVYTLERTGGRHWSAAGLAPWIFLGLYVLAVQVDSVTPVRLDVPVSLPPLFVLGLGWCVLRGLRPGRVRRQEYTFALVWLACSALLLPLVPIGHTPGAELAASVTVLPVLLLFAGRAARALWEGHESPVARVAVSVYAWAPVAAYVAAAVAPPAPWLRAALVGAAALGLLAVIAGVRPDAPAPVLPEPRQHGPRRGPRRGGRGGRGGHGGRGGRGGRGGQSGPRRSATPR